MKKVLVCLSVAFLVSAAVLFSIADLVGADPITVTKPFHFRDNRSANTALTGQGEMLTYGAHYVVPNGDNGTTGSATQGPVTTPLEFDPFSAAPNQFGWAVPYNPNLTGQWTLTFNNGPDITTVQTPSVGTAPQLPFAASVAISGSGFTPTFSWTFPESYTPNGIRIMIWDLEHKVSLHAFDIIHVHVLPGTATSYTVPAVLSTGKTLEQGHLYSLEITFALTHGEPLGDNTTLLSRSRSFFNFIPLPEGSPPNVFLPIVTPGPQPVYEFRAPVVEGQTIFIDPAVAVGYEYAIGAGNPNFASVILPAGIGNNWYQLYLFKGTKYSFKARLKGGIPYTFPPGGVDRFLILGIERDVGLDPNNPTAFVTGLTFTGSGEFTGTMKAITECFEPSVTGHGWIQSPAGAYPPDAMLGGYGKFDFVAKYKKDSTVPTGKTQFVYPAGQLRFVSNTYESLEANQAGTNILLKGVGTINGTGDYSFAIWASDESRKGGADTFRIKIWETATEAIVYDNEESQEICGSIVIHKKWDCCE